MPPSQLKALKASLREKGITGPQQSKKQKKSKHARQNPHDRQTALQQIRDSFNPFELRPGNARPAKFESVSAKSQNGAANGKYAAVLHRPGVSKSVGEEMRRAQLLPEMRRRNKFGGLVDRRIGEGDEGMTAEERAAQRFAREKARGGKSASLFDLEESDDDGADAGFGLTHGGRRLDDLAVDDFQASASDVEGSEDDAFLKRKRPREDADNGAADAEAGGDDEPERKKTKKEVMQEVVAKSKLHKYERQKAKEDDEDLREQLDAGMSDLMALLRGHKPPPKDIDDQPEAMANAHGPKMDPGRQALLEGMSRADADKEYERRLRELAQDTRAKPSERTKTEDERAKEEAERLQRLEERRMKRMQGQEVSDEDGDAGVDGDIDVSNGLDAYGEDDAPDDAEAFGFTNTVKDDADEDEKVQHVDEDDFEYDDDLIASDSDAELSEDESELSGASDAEVGATRDEKEEDEFVKGILGDGGECPISGANAITKATPSGLSYTYPCPQTHDELLAVLEGTKVDQLPTVIQRIRALHHVSLSAANKESMSDFSTVLVDHVVHMANNDQPMAVTEQVIRHVHSLSRTYATPIAERFRHHLLQWHERFSVKPVQKGDLMLLVAIAAIFPTSDHFHAVVTPAITLMGRWLALNLPDPQEKAVIGGSIVGICLHYQRLSKRYIPEAVRFTLRALSTAADKSAHLTNLTTMADLWSDKTAFSEIFSPFLPILRKIGAKKQHQHLTVLLRQATLRRRPLELHHHRTLPIRTSIPKFEEGFNPDKHYDPDKERSDAKKLQKEVKRERKGALRELRKDANFMAREQLREKRERDAEYERKQRRLIAEIQGEEAHEAKNYERERERRKKSRS